LSSAALTARAKAISIAERMNFFMCFSYKPWLSYFQQLLLGRAQGFFVQRRFDLIGAGRDGMQNTRPAARPVRAGHGFPVRQLMEFLMMLSNCTKLAGCCLFGLTLISSQAQFGPPGARPQGPQLGGSMVKLFGDNSTFSATVTVITGGGSAAESITMPGKLAFDQGKSRFEMDLTQMKSENARPEMAAQMKSMGMDKMVMISRPEKNVKYLVYPGLESYTETPLTDSKEEQKPDDYIITLTELGKETVEGHACVKNKAIVTDKQGKKDESIIWNATDLKKFPIKIQHQENGSDFTMLFKDVSLAKVDAAQFDPPAGMTKYENVQTMMQQAMMKRFGGMGGMPPGAPKPPQ
jgi:hypothetical protein